MLNGVCTRTGPSVQLFESASLPSPIRVLERQLSGIGFHMWPAATFLCRWLERRLADPEDTLLRLPAPLAEMKCLELGTAPQFFCSCVYGLCS